MIVRPLLPEDIPILESRAAESGYPYPDLGNVETTLVVVDRNEAIITACAAKKIVELYLYPMAGDSLTKKRALEMLHCQMAPLLKAKGYTEANSFLPGPIAEKFGRRLERTFGWVRNWTSWARTL